MRARVETELTEVGTLLGDLASSLRNFGWSIAGLSGREPNPESLEFRDMQSLARSLMRTAGVIEFVRGGLCQECRMRDFRELVAFGDKPEAEGKKKGGRGYGQKGKEERQEGGFGKGRRWKTRRGKRHRG